MTAPLPEQAVEAVMSAMSEHRWKTMGTASVECECGGIFYGDESLTQFPADEAFRRHIATVALEAAALAGETHELVFTDREARPAKWETRCGRTDVPLENAISLPAGHYPVTCKACIRIAELERLADEMLAAFPGPASMGIFARWRQVRYSGEAAVAAADELSQLGQELQGDQP